MRNKENGNESFEHAMNIDMVRIKSKCWPFLQTYIKIRNTVLVHIFNFGDVLVPLDFSGTACVGNFYCLCI